MIAKRSDLDPLPAHLLIPEPGEDAIDDPIARVWERLPRESDRDWYLFMLYRDQAYQAGRYQPRNLAEVARTAGVVHSSIQEAAAAFRWVQRAGAWDREVDRREGIAKLSEHERRARAHLRFASKLRGLAEIEIEKVIARAMADQEGPTLKPREIFEAFEVAMKIEAMTGSGGTLAQAQDQTPADLEKLEMDDLLKLKEIFEKAQK